MANTTEREKAVNSPPKVARKLIESPKKRPARLEIESTQPVSSMSVSKLRDRLGLTQTQFAPMLPVSVRSLATLERGTAPTEAVARRLTELERLVKALSEVIKKETIGRWLRTPNPAFAGSTPAEVIERGEADRLWAMIYFLRSGVAF